MIPGASSAAVSLPVANATEARRQGSAVHGNSRKEAGFRYFPLDRGSIALLLFALAVATGLAFAPALFNDGDTSWHLGAGKLILDTMSVPATDPFSFTFAGRPWTAHEWLAEVLMAAAFAVASWGGLAVLTASAVAGLLVLLGAELRRWLPVPRVIVALTLVTAMLAPFILARPHVLAWPIVAGWAILLMRARERHRAPPLAAALLMILWANLHGSFVLGFVLAGFFALEALLFESDRRRTLVGWGAFGLAALILSLLTPHGLHGLLYPLQVSSMKALPLIMEWRHTDVSQDWLFVAVVVGTVLLVLIRRARLSPVRLILLAATVYLAWSHVRHQPLVAILGALLLAEPLSRSSHAARAYAGANPKVLATLFALGLLLIGAVRIPMALPRKDSASNPLAAIRHVPGDLRGRPVFNSYGFGGPLILNGIRPYIDGRGDMYGDAFMLEHQLIIDGDVRAFGRAVRKWGIAWTLLAPNDPLVAQLDRSAGWERLYSDRWAVVHVRK